MCACMINTSACLLVVSPTSMSTWWVLCLLYAATHTCSLWWTVQHIGPRPDPSKLPPQQLASTPSLSGSPVWGHCHCDLRLRLPVHFLVLVCLLSLPGHHDDRLPTSVQRHGRENTSSAEGSFGGTPLFWPSELPWVLLGLRSVPLEQSGVSSAELVFGTPPTLPGNSCWRPSSRRRSFSTTSTTSWIPSFCFWCTVHRLPPSGPMHLPLALWQAEYVFIC